MIVLNEQRIWGRKKGREGRRMRFVKKVGMKEGGKRDDSMATICNVMDGNGMEGRPQQQQSERRKGEGIKNWRIKILYNKWGENDSHL
jgi:hypothetical protein